MLCSPVCHSRPSYRCSVSSTLLSGWYIVLSQGTTSQISAATRNSSSCVCSSTRHWLTSTELSLSCHSLSLQDIEVGGQPTIMPCSFHEHHWSLVSGRSVLLVLQLGTAFQQTFGQPAFKKKLKTFLFTKLYDTSFYFVFYNILYLLVGWSAAAVSFYCLLLLLLFFIFHSLLMVAGICYVKVWATFCSLEALTFTWCFSSLNQVPFSVFTMFLGVQLSEAI